MAKTDSNIFMYVLREFASTYDRRTDRGGGGGGGGGGNHFT